MTIQTFSNRWSSKTSDSILEAHPGLKSELTRFSVWFLTRNGMDTDTEMLVEAGEERGVKDLKSIHLAHAKRILSGTKYKASKPLGKPKGSKNKVGQVTTYGSNAGRQVSTQVIANSSTVVSLKESLQAMGQEYRMKANFIDEILATIGRDVANVTIKDVQT